MNPLIARTYKNKEIFYFNSGFENRDSLGRIILQFGRGEKWGFEILKIIDNDHVNVGSEVNTKFFLNILNLILPSIRVLYMFK